MPTQQEIETILAEKRAELETQLDAEREALEQQNRVNELRSELALVEEPLRVLYEQTVKPLLERKTELEKELKALSGSKRGVRKPRTPKVPTAELVEFQEAVLDKLTTMFNGKLVSCSTLAINLNRDAKEVSLALKALVQVGKVSTVGQRRGMLYQTK